MARKPQNQQIKTKAIAKSLYLADSGLTIKELAERLGTAPATCSKWVKEEGWDALRKNLLTTKKAQLSRLYDLLERATGADKPNADDISKLTAAIERLESQTSIADIVGVAREMTAFVAQGDYEKSKELVMLFDAFIQHKLKSV